MNTLLTLSPRSLQNGPLSLQKTRARIELPGTVNVMLQEVQ